MKCKNDSSRYYKGDEPSPKGRGYCAHAEKIGTRKLGLDGDYWIVIKTNSGVKRWYQPKKASKKASNKESNKTSKKASKKDIEKGGFISKKDMTNNRYTIIDNGGTPFVVKTDPINEEICVYTYEGDDEPETTQSWFSWLFGKKQEDPYTKEIMCFKNFKGYWPGLGSNMYYKNTNRDGNSILIKEKDNQYIIITSKIYRFNTADEISNFRTPIGNSAITYPTAFGTDNMYFLFADKYIKNKNLLAKPLIKNTTDLIDEVYGWGGHTSPSINIKKKVLQKRL